MYKSIYFTLSLLALPLTTLAGPSHAHGNSALRPAHRRHHARHAHAVAAGQPRNSPARRAREEEQLQFEKRVTAEIERRSATTVECDDGDEYENDATNSTLTTTTTTSTANTTAINGTSRDLSGTCTDGTWQCSGPALHHCDHSAWVLVANCTGEDLVCSDDPAQTGCIWSWDLKNSTSTSDDGDEDCEDDDDSTTSASNSTSIAASQSDDGDDDCDDEDGESTPSSSFTSQSASITSAPSASASVIGGNLWAGASQSQGWNNNGNGNGKGKHHKQSSTNDWNNWGASSSASDDWSDWSSASSSDNSWDSWSTSSSDNWWDSASSTTNDWSASSTQGWSSASPTHKSGKGGKNNNGGNSGNSPSASASSGSSWNKTSGGSSGGKSSGGGSNGNWQAPHYVIYADEWLNTMPDASDIGSYNRFILAFWMSGGSGAVDDAQAWEQFSDSYRQQILTEYHNAGIALMVSAFGSTDAPTTNGADATQTAQALASWVKQYGLDGVDIDYEDMQAMNGNYAESWLITFQQELRNSLGSGYLISHAPVAPWFTSSNAYSSGAYVKIQQEVGDTIDFYNVQFYNQGNGVYTDCNSLIFNSGGDWPSTSVMEINSYAGVPLNKIVIGKPNDASAADNGYMSPSDLANCVGQAQQKGWNGGVMFWEWANNHQSLLADVNISA